MAKEGRSEAHPERFRQDNLASEQLSAKKEKKAKTTRLRKRKAGALTPEQAQPWKGKKRKTDVRPLMMQRRESAPTPETRAPKTLNPTMEEEIEWEESSDSNDIIRVDSAEEDQENHRPKVPSKRKNSGEEEVEYQEPHPFKRARALRALDPHVWVRVGHNRYERIEATMKTAGIVGLPNRKMEDVYRDYPEKKLVGEMGPSILCLAGRVILQLVNEATQLWFGKWFPDMKVGDVFDAIRVVGREVELDNKQHVVPAEALDRDSMTTTLAEMFRQCHSLLSNGGEEFDFPRLLRLIDECAIFTGVLRAEKYQNLLQKVREEFKWFPLRLNSRKYLVLARVQTKLEVLEQRYEALPNLPGWVEKRHYDELAVLDGAWVEYSNDRQNIQLKMLTALNMLASCTTDQFPL